MKSLSISRDIIPLGEFKSRISKWFKHLQETGQPLIITQHGKPAGVLLSPQEYDELVYRTSFLDSIERGLDDAEHGKLYTTKRVVSDLSQDKHPE